MPASGVRRNEAISDVTANAWSGCFAAGLVFFISMFSRSVTSLVGAWPAMLALDAAHTAYPQVPAFGYWAVAGLLYLVGLALYLLEGVGKAFSR